MARAPKAKAAGLWLPVALPFLHLPSTSAINFSTPRLVASPARVGGLSTDIPSPHYTSLKRSLVPTSTHASRIEREIATHVARTHWKSAT